MVSDPIEAGDRSLESKEVSASDGIGAPSGDSSPEVAAAPPSSSSDGPDAPNTEESGTEESGTEESGTEESVDDSRIADGDLAKEALDEEDEDGDEDEFRDVAPLEEITDEEDDGADKNWFILKVQSNRERSICEGLHRRVKIEGLERYFGEIIVPTEDVAEFKNGTRRIVKRKLYPGYIVVNMVLNDDTWFIVRETPGIGDFTGSVGKPTPMLPEEVDRIIRAAHPEEDDSESVKTAIPFKLGDRVRIKEGTFENFEGDVDVVDEANGRVTVMINIFGRSTPVELEHWQIESV